MPSETATLIFEESRSTISSREFAHFLYLFRAAYGAALYDMPWRNLSAETLNANRSQYIQEFYAATTTSLLRSDVAEWFHLDLDDRELLFTKIVKESPLSIWTRGVITALVFAVILSGGEVNLAKGQFKLKPLGQGIEELNKALSPFLPTKSPPSSQQSSGSQSRSSAGA